jgi:hypothetical protein
MSDFGPVAEDFLNSGGKPTPEESMKNHEDPGEVLDRPRTGWLTLPTARRNIEIGMRWPRTKLLSWTNHRRDGPAETILATELSHQDKLSLTIVLVEHDMSVVMKISDEVLCLNEGRVLACGSPNEISCNEEVQRVYLGGRKEC